MQRTVLCLAHPNHAKATRKRGMWWRPGRAGHKNLEHFARKNAGISKFEQQPSHRVPVHARFNPEGVVNTKGASGEAMKWWHHHRLMIPSIPPKGYADPSARGKEAWPTAWSTEHAAGVLSLSPAALRESVLSLLQKVIHEEVLSDGYDMRDVDFEGNPKTQLPDMGVIEAFVLAEQTLRDRVLHRVLDEELRLPVTSVHRRDIRSVQTLLRHVEVVVATCREPSNYRVPTAVSDYLANLTVQPRFGFQFALPVNPRSKLEQEWERLFIHDWQFGKAVYEPRSTESTRGNLVWLRLQQDWDARKEFVRKQHNKA